MNPSRTRSTQRLPRLWPPRHQPVGQDQCNIGLDLPVNGSRNLSDVWKSDVTNGMIFGPVVGTAITWSGAVLGALAVFVLARGTGKPAVERFGLYRRSALTPNYPRSITKRGHPMHRKRLTALYTVLFLAVPMAVAAQDGPGNMGSGSGDMMGGMMDCMGDDGMMILFPMLIMVLLVVLLVMGIIALAKYLRQG